MSFDALFALLGLVLVALAWQANLAAREAANRVAGETCARAGVQLLDGTVAFLNLRLVRSPSGGFALRRTYVFDYTEDGYERRRGFVVLLGDAVESVGLGPRAVT